MPIAYPKIIRKRQPKQSKAEILAAKREVAERAGGLCEIRISGVRCLALGVDFHRLCAGSHGGLYVPSNLVLSCRTHHYQITFEHHKHEWTAEYILREMPI